MPALQRKILYQVRIKAIDNALIINTVINGIGETVYNSGFIANEHLDVKVNLKLQPSPANNTIHLHGINSWQNGTIHHNPYHFYLDIFQMEKENGSLIEVRVCNTINVTSNGADAPMGVYLEKDIPVSVPANSIIVDDESQL